MIGVCRSVAITGSTEVGAELNRQSAATIKKLGSEPAILNGRVDLEFSLFTESVF
jgi:hypothetical protein